MAGLCVDLAERWDWTLTIGHCDHGWRDDSADNARFVGELAERWGLPFLLRVASTSPVGEASAREWRYRQLVAIAAEFGATHIATGHTASDRAETFLHHLLRGTGTDGLSAIARSRDLAEFCDGPRSPQLVRPLFEIFRQETADFCRDRQLAIWEDATNNDERYTRNRIRHSLLPLLSERFNPRAEAAIVRASASLARDRDCLEALAADWGQRVRDRERPDRLYRPTLRRAHPALQRRILRDWLRERLGNAVGFERIEAVAALIDAPQKTRTDPVADARIVEVCGDWLAIVTLER